MQSLESALSQSAQMGRLRFEFSILAVLFERRPEVISLVRSSVVKDFSS